MLVVNIDRAPQGWAEGRGTRVHTTRPRQLPPAFQKRSSKQPLPRFPSAACVPGPDPWKCIRNVASNRCGYQSESRVFVPFLRAFLTPLCINVKKVHIFLLGRLGPPLEQFHGVLTLAGWQERRISCSVAVFFPFILFFFPFISFFFFF